MRKFFNFVLLAGGVYLAVQMNGGIDGIVTDNIADKLAPGNQVVMYSLTTCPYCRQKRQQMTGAGIPYTEFFIDSDQAKAREFTALLAKHNAPPGAAGVPSLLVNGELLLNNPSMSDIKKYLKYKG